MSRPSPNALIAAMAALSLLLPGPAAAGTAGAAAAANRAADHVEVLRLAAGTPPLGLNAAPRRVSAVPAPCSDRSYNLHGARWRSTLRWYFRASSTPAGLTRRAAVGAIRRGIANITRARNDCGRGDRINAGAKYLGHTNARPSCKRTDGRNVVGFAALPDGTAARACWWMSGARIVEADIQVNSSLRWATSLAGCVNELMLEAVMTHEAGHVFGLGHVSERRHGRLTMSTYLDGVCNNQEATLGLGDMLGLEALYP